MHMCVRDSCKPGCIAIHVQLLVLQDLSVYSWLDCEPDDLYKLTKYSLYEVQDAFPHPIPDYLDNWMQHGPGMQHLSPWLTAIGQFSFIARPMQVCGGGTSDNSSQTGASFGLHRKMQARNV